MSSRRNKKKTISPNNKSTVFEKTTEKTTEKTEETEETDKFKILNKTTGTETPKDINTEKQDESITSDNRVSSEKTKKEDMFSSSRSRSIVMQITADRLVSSLITIIAADIMYVFLLFGAFVYDKEMQVNGALANFGKFEFVHNELLIYDSNGVSHAFITSNIVTFMLFSLAVVLIIEIIVFLFKWIVTPVKINNKLMPLYTLTEATRALSFADLTGDEFSTLQDAIKNISPSEPDTQLHTGRQEFVGMEDAINDLLGRIRNSYKSQARFVSDAAHELRTPIAVIQGYANMLDRWGREDKEILDESIKSIKGEADNMNRLVENLLFLARGDSGRTVLRFETVGINQLLCDIYNTHEFRLDLRADIVSRADVSLLKQCLRILVDNAIKYSPEGTDIILRLQNREDGYYSIDVQDYGIGIKADDADKIFERFFRSDPARNRQNGGTGLGLSIAKWIADKHNAYFEVLSYENIGTRISLVMPYLKNISKDNINDSTG